MIEALAEKGEDGGWIISSPGVGILRSVPRPGSHRTGGDTVGQLRVLGRAREMALPAGVSGRVGDVAIRDRAVPVQYGQRLFLLHPAGAALEAPPVRAETGAAAGIPEGCAAMACPIDGIFYRRPAPGLPPFVEAGSAILAGRTVGLIEAMKSFNAVIYGGPGLPGEGVVVEVRAEDGAEVRQGQPLLVVRPGN